MTHPVDPPATPHVFAKTRLPLILAIASTAAVVTAGALYLALRRAESPAMPAPAAAVVRDGAADGAAHARPQQTEAMVERLAARLEREQANGPGWQMLGRSYAAMGRFGDAARAYARAAALLPPSADLLADQADVLAMNQSGRFDGEPARLIREALKLDPNHPKALALAGTEAFGRRDYRDAQARWETALKAVPRDSDFALAVRASIDSLPGRGSDAVAASGERASM